MTLDWTSHSPLGYIGSSNYNHDIIEQDLNNQLTTRLEDSFNSVMEANVIYDFAKLSKSMKVTWTKM